MKLESGPWARRVLSALLVASLGTNAWLLTRSSDPGAKSNQPAVTEQAPPPERPPDADTGEFEASERQDLLGSLERDWLRRAGFAAPAESLRADLLRHPELIPAAGVLGGTMAFQPSSIYLLPGRHVWAIAEDGHIEHAMLLRYDVLPDTTLRWDVVYHREP